MSEKKLEGFYRENALWDNGRWCVDESKLVSVRLASESVGLKALRELRSKRLKEMLDRDEEREFGNGYLCAIDEVIELAVKEAKRND